jgi:hypothetical protein
MLYFIDHNILAIALSNYTITGGFWKWLMLFAARREYSNKKEYLKIPVYIGKNQAVKCLLTARLFYITMVKAFSHKSIYAPG